MSYNKLINFVFSWIQSETGGAVRRIIDTEPGSGTRLLVASLLNFRPRWLYPFDPALTRENGLFYLPGGERYDTH